MPVLKKSLKSSRSGISFIPLENIRPNPSQPRRHFAADALEELAQSIAQHGLLNPLTVRRRGDGYELVAGERRLRACRIAGLREAPCLIIDVDAEESGILALVENIQRRDLDFVEEAQGIMRLIQIFGISQEEAARRLGKSQSSVANKLRLLKLPPALLATLQKEGLTERHGRALLRLKNPEDQWQACQAFLDGGMNVRAAEEYVDSLLASAASRETEKSEVEELTGRRRTLFVLKDVRVFLNTLTHSLEVMKRGGIDAGFEKHETDTELVLTISIPKQK